MKCVPWTVSPYPGESGICLALGLDLGFPGLPLAGSFIFPAYLTFLPGPAPRSVTLCLHCRVWWPPSCRVRTQETGHPGLKLQLVGSVALSQLLCFSGPLCLHL